MSYLDTYLGQLDAALSDPAVMELAINADGTIWVERSGQIHMGPSELAPLPARSVRDLAAQIANSTSNTFTEAAPLVSAAVRYRDVQHLVPYLLQIGMFVTPVVYAVKLLPARFQWLLQLNPVYLILESQRDVLIRQSTPDWASLGLLLVALLLANLATLMLFGRLNRRFARIVQE